MTGFAAFELACDNGSLRCDVKSVNHRHIEVRTRGPAGMSTALAAIEKMFKERCVRGRVDVSFTWSPHTISTNAPSSSLDSAIARITEIRDSHDPGQPLPWHLLREFGAFDSSQDCATPTEENLTEAATGAVEALLAMRLHEGDALAQFIRAQLQEICRLHDQISQLQIDAADTTMQRKRTTLGRLLSGVSLDGLEQRLLLEIALLVEKHDVTEELDRLAAHAEAATTLLGEKNAVGKRLDFLAQELHREANTLTTKSWSVRQKQAALELRRTVEQFREQVQNIV